MLHDVYRDGLTAKTYNDWKSTLSRNTVANISQKEMFDPIKGVVERRYAPFDPARCKYTYLGPVTNPISDKNAYRRTKTG
jgi:hypothetical protein